MEDLYKKFLNCGFVCTDTRKIQPGSMFFALHGSNFDGNDFALAALEDGAAWAVVDKGLDSKDSRLIKVEDSLLALQQLAKRHRQSFDIPVLGITGTNGKTTTKELINAVLSKKYRTLCTQGNLNNHIGVPLTLLGISANTEIAIIEMGASHPGEIASSVNMALPNYGLITNVGRAHLEGFGSFEGVKQTKGELYDFLESNCGQAFFNSDNSDICGMKEERKNLKGLPYGVRYSRAVILPVDVNEPYLRLKLHSGEFMETRLVGSYNADNVMAALAVAEHFSVPLADAIAAIEEYCPSNNRSQMFATERNLLIVDTYNANHTSMNASLDNFAATDFKNKVLILGDMMELGDFSLEAHVDILKKACTISGEIFLVSKGEFSRAIEQVPQAAKARVFKTAAELKDYFSGHPLQEKTILLKGSNSTKLFILPEVL